MEWNITAKYIEITPKNYKPKIVKNLKIASFDLDSTLIKTKSKKRFAGDEHDWEFYSKNVIEKLKSLYDRDFIIIIITNQAGLKNDKTINVWRKKMDEILSQINLPIKLYASTSHNKFRKPLPTLLLKFYEDYVVESINKESFYCGDACGRENDHSDCDLKFALNNKIKFITPEELFLDEKVTYPQIVHQAHEEIKLNGNELNYKPNGKELIMMVGYPGSGKSTFTKEFVEQYPQFMIINRDSLNITISKCLKIVEKYINSNQSLIIDNLNSDKETRKKYIDIAKAKKSGYKITVIKIDVSENMARHNANYRCYKGGEPIPNIVYNIYNKKYDEPSKNEGIDEIINYKPKYVSDDKDYNELYLF